MQLKPTDNKAVRLWRRLLFYHYNCFRKVGTLPCMERQIIPTSDGSLTVAVPELHVNYHSIHGAIQESVHVYIQAGLNYMMQKLKEDESISIFEMGFGTGLNAFLTAIEAGEQQRNINYSSVELHPLPDTEISLLNYTDILGRKELFQQLHQVAWNENSKVTEYFTLNKQQVNLAELHCDQKFHVVYYDAFAPTAQPELWTIDLFEKLYNMLLPGGILVTYCSKGNVRRAMQAAGFHVEKLPGPKWKREMVRAGVC